jgi:protein-disulfide isomerase
MKKSLSNALTLGLACFGCLLAFMLTIEYFRPTTLPCSVHSNGCAGTLNSNYAHVGPIPTAAFGLLMYATLATLCWKRKQRLATDRQMEEARARAYATADADPQTADSGALLDPLKSSIRYLDLAIWGLALLALVTSWWLQYVSIWQLNSFCPYCFTSALTVTTIFVLATRDAIFDARILTGEQKLLIGVVVFVGAMLLFIVVPDAINQVNRGIDITPHQVTYRLRDVVVKPDMNMMGDPKAKYILVEFADYFCPHCQEASEKIPAILKQHPEIRLAYRNYVLGLPQPKFPHSDRASIAAEAAARQGKFWQMHDYLFAHQKQMQDLSFTDDMFVDYARAIGLDIPRFQKDMADTKLMDKVIQDHQDGDTAGMDMTPTFYLVTPDKVTRFVGDGELTKIMNDPKHEAWK